MIIRPDVDTYRKTPISPQTAHILSILTDKWCKMRIVDALRISCI